MVGNLEPQNESVQYMTNLSFTNVSTCSGRNIIEIISEYNIDFSLKMYLPACTMLDQCALNMEKNGRL